MDFMTRNIRRSAAAALAFALALAAGCAVGPNYKRPAFSTTPAYKEDSGWKPSEPSDALTRGPWWKIFKDDELDQLEAKIDISNENVKQAVAAYDQAKALVDQARAGLLPTLDGSASRIRSSSRSLDTATGKNTSSGTGTGTTTTGTTTTGTTTTGTTTTGTTTIIGNTSGQTITTYTAGLSANWTIDIWGQIRRTVESDKASAQASAAALAAARLSAQTTLATDYFELRAQDQLQKLLDDTVVAEQLSLKITESRYRFGVAAKADVVSAEAQLLSSQAQQINAKIQRATLEHAIAVLVGLQPAEFSLSPVAMRTDVPTVPGGVPSALLERRPDVAEAERKMAAANAQIGVAKAAYFPSLTLSGSDQYSSSAWSHLDQPAESSLVLGTFARGNLVRRRRAPRAGGTGARGLRPERRELSADGAVGLRAGRG